MQGGGPGFESVCMELSAAGGTYVANVPWEREGRAAAHLVPSVLISGGHLLLSNPFSSRATLLEREAGSRSRYRFMWDSVLVR